ncbi:flagellar type III secretion system protein FliR [Heliobacterium gestii]|uniref:Flagellar biosynthetic protein FliR n=1 Tax=Heliomicrobium gestii TaxID=2699 RepID=A0A845LJ50_HELGE|nr:flagellar biosynthetic protein FliR [Heliomicrobium gestii]MBM7867123.1 flagellar biosynthetic protein FliR [Heliomicrobium gestii]MZP43463.1 flagellar type III secretion system protein FliR [Heliomicrobium gestii]
MEAVINTMLNHLDVLLLMMTRVAGIMVLAPVFNFQGFNNLAKIGLSFMIALILFLAMPNNALPVPPHDLLSYALVVAQEVLLGLAIGFILQLVFAAILTAGQLIDIQLGFGIVNVIDPLWGAQVPMTGILMQILALLIFVIFDGHLLLIQVLADSFRILPVAGSPFSLALSGNIADFMVRLVSGVLLIGVQLAMPIIGIILINDIALGLVSRTVPQMNLFVIGIPLKIIVGVAFLWITLPFYIEGLNRLYTLSFSQVSDFMRILSP